MLGMNSKSLIIIQRIAGSMIGSQGQFLDEPVGVVRDAGTNKEGIKRLKYIIEIILNSQDISKYTKKFIVTPNASIKEVFSLVNNEERGNHTKIDNVKETYGYSHVVKILAKDCKLIMDTLGYNVILDCMENKLIDYVDIDNRIIEFISKYGASCNERNNLLLDVGSNIREKTKYCGNPEFFKILEKLRPYLISEKKKTEKEVVSNQEFIGYFNYLLSLAPILGDSVARKDRELLLKFLNGEDISYK